MSITQYGWPRRQSIGAVAVVVAAAIATDCDFSSGLLSVQSATASKLHKTKDDTIRTF